MTCKHLIAAPILGLALAGLAQGAGADTLRLLTWGGYAPDNVVEMFEKETGHTVEVTKSNNEEMIAKLRATGGGGFDLAQPSQDRMRLEGVLGPMLRFQVPHHQELREREEAQLHPVPVDRPSRAPLDTVGELFEIGFGAEALVIEDFRQLESEIRAQPFLEGQVGDDLGIAGAQVEGGAPVIPNEFDGRQDQGRLAHHI